MLAFLRTHKYAGALIIGWIIVSWFGVDYFSRRATADYLIQERHVAGEHAELLARSTSDIVGQLQGIAQVLARGGSIRAALELRKDASRPHNADEESRRKHWVRDPYLADLDTTLRSISNSFAADDVWILNAEGFCIAASDAGRIGSAIGKSLVDQPYFQGPRSGAGEQLYAIAAVGDGLGFYYSAPVIDDGHFIGAVVSKTEVHTAYAEMNHSRFFVADGRGVIVLVSDRLIESRAIPPVLPSSAKEPEQGDLTSLKTLRVKPWGSGNFPEVVTVGNSPEAVLLLDKELREGGISVHMIHPLPGLERIEGTRLWFFLMISVVGGALILAGSLFARERCKTIHHQEELKRAAERLALANSVKSAFLANISHEIRTPMNGVIGMTSLLMDTELTAEQLDYAETLRTSAENMLVLINDILDFSNISAGKLDVEKIDFNLQPMLDGIAEPFARRAVQAGLKLIWSIDPRVPLFVRGDPGRVRQILSNLAGNAIKFTDAGEVSLRVTADAETDSTVVVRFEVKDTGIGIPEDRMASLFTPFMQGDVSTTRRYGGVGLGLAINKQLVTLLGGDIGCRSKEGKGTTFWFTVKFEKQATAGDQPKISSLADDVSDRVLIVVHNDADRKMKDVLLASWGLRHEFVADGESAMKLLHEAAQHDDPFRLVLIDQQLGATDGRDLGRRIKDDPALKSASMILITAIGQRGDAAECEKIGFSGYLTKPLRKETLHGCIALVMARSNDGVSDASIVTKYTIAELDSTKARILVVDDNIVNQKVTQAMLNILGYSVDLAANGLEAVKALELIDYEIVLMDCQMPEMDGYEATRIIRDSASRVINHAVPIVAVTANTGKGEREKCLEAGMDDYLTKPVNVGRLHLVLLGYQDRSTKQAVTQPPLEPVVVAVPESQAGDDLPVLDTAAALVLLGGDVSTLEMMLPLVLSQIEVDRHEISSAIRNGDANLVRKVSHRLKGSVDQIGAVRARDACLDLQQAGKNNEIDRFVELEKVLEAELDKLVIAITAYSAKDSSRPI